MKPSRASRITASAVATSAIASGVSHGAIEYSGPVNYTIQPLSGDTYVFDLNGDEYVDFEMQYLTDPSDLNSLSASKPALEALNGDTYQPPGTVASVFATDLILVNDAPNSSGNADRGGVLATPAGVVVDGDFLDGLVDFGYMNEDIDGAAVGGFTDGTTAYVGLQMSDGENVTYGWAQFEYLNNADETSLTLIDYAYETTPGLGIETGAVPEPSTSLLALVGGAAGLAVLRKRRKAA